MQISVVFHKPPERPLHSKPVVQSCSLKNIFFKFSKIHRKTPVLQSFLSKVACLRPETSSKMRLLQSCFPLSFAKFLGTPFSIEHLRRLFLYISDTDLNHCLMFYNQDFKSFFVNQFQLPRGSR